MTDRKDWIPTKKQSAEKVKIKPPTQKKVLHKIDFPTRVLIHRLSEELPQVPFFIMKDNKAMVQKIATGKRISGAELLEQDKDAKVAGEPVNYKKEYIQRGSNIRMMNHKVSLNSQYQLLGQQGIDSYVAYVNDLATQLSKLQEKLEVKKEDFKDAMIVDQTHPVQPMKNDFGYVFFEITAPEDQEGEWTVSGGEQAYISAMADYEGKMKALGLPLPY